MKIKILKTVIKIHLLSIALFLTACQESPQDREIREIREAATISREKAWYGQRTCIELIKRVSRNPATTQVPELYNPINIANMPYRDGHIALFNWTGPNLVQAQNGFGILIGVEATCEYDINTEQVYGFAFNGQVFMSNGETL